MKLTLTTPLGSVIEVDTDIVDMVEVGIDDKTFEISIKQK